MAAPAFRAAATASGDFATSVTVGPPTGLTDNDIMWWWLYMESTADVTFPAGWTEVLTVTATSSAFRSHLAWKRASSESGDYTASWTGNAWRTSCIVAYSGAITSGDPQSGTGAAQANGSTNKPKTPSMTTADANTRVIAFCCNYGYYNAGTPPAGMTERVDLQEIGVADVEQASAGATGEKEFTSSATNQAAGAIVAIKEPTTAKPAFLFYQ
jgi:hypothetical protein